MLMRLALLATAFCTLSACSGTDIKVNSIPDQPRIVAGDIHGQRVCNAFTTTDQVFNFTCDALPTNVATGWQLSPLDIESKNADNQAVVKTNLFVTIEVVTPTMTNLKALYKNTLLMPVAASPHVLPTESVGHQGEYVLAVADDGTHKFWTLIFRINPCLESSEVNIFNMSLDGAARSNPLSVIFLRAPDEVRDSCGDFPATGGATHPPVMGTTSNPVPSTTSPTTGGPCNGQAEQQFMACEVCVQIPAALGVSGCSFAEALRNYNLPNAGCYVNQVADANQCYP